MLILFDVDGTLITTSRAGIEAMGKAGRSLYGHAFDHERTDYAGRLDPLIIADLLSANGIDPGANELQRFRRAYSEQLERLFSGEHAGATCPGVGGLLDALEAHEQRPTLGLLTGNYPDTGALKLRACGVDPRRFAVQVWGCDSPHDPPERAHLPPVGIERYRALTGTTIAPARVRIIGDTPHDVACARAHAIPVLGVATGRHSVEELASAGADRAVPDLSDTTGILEWLMPSL